YDTYGFPKELTDEYIQEYGFDIDEVGFKTEMNKQRERARAARVDNESMHAQSELLTTLKTKSTFVGYQSEKVTTNISAIIAENEEIMAERKKKQKKKKERDLQKKNKNKSILDE